MSDSMNADLYMQQPDDSLSENPWIVYRYLCERHDALVCRHIPNVPFGRHERADVDTYAQMIAMIVKRDIDPESRYDRKGIWDIPSELVEQLALNNHWYLLIREKESARDVMRQEHLLRSFATGRY